MTAKLVVVWPGASELGIRVRRILAAFLRQMATDARRKKKLELKQEKDLVKKEKSSERNRNFTKKERNGKFFLNTEFRRVLLSFGVETVGSKRVWDRFRELSGITKSDEVLEENFEKTLSMCNECIEISKTRNTADINESETIRVERGPDSISLDVAKRLLKRLEMMRKLREEIIPHPMFDQNIDNLKRHQRSGLPSYESF